MALLISTNMYRAGDFKRVLPYLGRFDDQIGVEIFPMFHDPAYENLLRESLPVLEKTDISFHGPYYGAEHSAPRGTLEYDRTKELVLKTLEYAKILDSRYVVYHHNNRPVLPENRREMIRISRENFREFERLFGEAGIPAVVENAGVLDRGNMLFDQMEFINLCKKENYRVLIDIGHAYANGWNLREVMEALQGQIVAYHLHNNDGLHDSHRRIRDGSLDFEGFLSDMRELTPQADQVLEYSLKVADDVEGIVEDVDYLLKKSTVG